MRIAMELVCASWEAAQAEVQRSVARISLAALMATMSADCRRLKPRLL